MMETVIFHNPACGTSRNVLALVRNAGIEPTVVEYLKTPLGREQLLALVAQLGVPVRAVLRQKGTPYAELGLGNPGLGDGALIDAIVAHPLLLERPIVMTPRGARLCRPSETVLDILPQPQQGAFAKEGGEQIVNARGERIAP